ncbi:MAG: MBOAT family O-acyltransferase [Rhodopila sp.]
MLFNSYPFLLAFLPVSLFACGLVDRFARLRIPLLVLLSLVFYGWWNAHLLPLLIGSVVANWLSAWAFTRWRRPGIIASIVVADLVLLGVCKYANFALGNAAALSGLPFTPLEITLPLGISFFTFHHIMYMVDLGRGKAPLAPFERYALYICFFPQAIAGPLARWSEVGQQFGRRMLSPGWERRWAMGIIFIVIGLIEKIGLGDPIGTLLDPIYAAAANGPVADGSAWLAPVFALQIFFDFSGYSDVAVGLALLLDVQLPYNFNAPFQARNILEFWTRWHMTLSRFLRDYVFLKLADMRVAGKRHSVWQYCFAILATMALCGLWHGAGWNFILWGTLQGLAMIFTLGWRRFVGSPPRVIGWTATVLFFALTAVIFRTGTLEAAWNIYAGFGVPPAPKLLSKSWPIAIALGIALFLPATQDVVRRLSERPWPAVPVVLGLAVVGLLVQLGGTESYDFIYFHF